MNVSLTKEQYNRLPYKTTTITKARTYGDIIGLLETHSVKNYRWTKLDDTDLLEFPLIIKKDGVDVGFTVKLTVPRLTYPKKSGRNGPITMTYLENTSWRMFWWHLKSKLEAIEFGISDEVKEFMYNIHFALPNGQEMSIGDMVLQNAESISSLPALTDNSSSREGENYIEAEFKVIKD